MVFGFSSMPQHIARNIIVGLDFDGTIAYGAHIRVWYARRFYRVSLTEQQILGETWPKELGKEKYRQMADAVDGEYMMTQQLAPGCKETLARLYGESFRFAVVTSRSQKLRDAAVRFTQHHGLPIKYFHATDHSPKNYLVNKLHARAFFDDGLYNLKPLLGSFVMPVFIRQPWNVHEPTPPTGSGVITVNNWPEFGKWMLQLKEAHEAICYFNRWENAYFNLSRIASFWKSQPGRCSALLKEYEKEKAVAGAVA